MTLDGKNEITGLDAKVPMCTSTTAGLKVHNFTIMKCTIWFLPGSFSYKVLTLP